MISIVEGCGTNITSIQSALERLGKQSIVTRDPAIIQAASHVILPGVGTAYQAMNKLAEYQLLDVIRQLQQPVLGICVGMQILYEYSYEGQIDCLKIFPGAVTPLSTVNLPLPHMGWNQIRIINTDSILLQNVPDQSYLYYVHSYAADMNVNTAATTHYGDTFCAITQQKNFFGVQFHPERSGKIGEIILQNFLNLARSL